MTKTTRSISRMTNDEFADSLSRDGYPSRIFARVRRAHDEGRLVWTTRHLVITGSDAQEFLPSR